MKYFAIPAVVLSMLLGVSLWNAATMEREAAPWYDALSEAQLRAEQADWKQARRIVFETQKAWDARRIYFHIVTAHDELESADALFAAAERFAEQHDAAEFSSCVAQLIIQLRIVAEMQQLTLRNIL